jgi:hypothetical protein
MPQGEPLQTLASDETRELGTCTNNQVGAVPVNASDAELQHEHTPQPATSLADSILQQQQQQQQQKQQQQHCLI